MGPRNLRFERGSRCRSSSLLLSAASRFPSCDWGRDHRPAASIRPPRPIGGDTLNIERMEYLGVVVDDLELGVQRFSDVFGLDFEILDTEELDVRAESGQGRAELV